MCEVCLQTHGEQKIQTESIASGLVISLVGNYPRCRVHYPFVLNFNVHDTVIELILVGVVRFIGGTPQEGHYFAVVKDFEDLSCWLCDDNKVSKTTENVLLGECAGNPVLLFYIRKEVLESERTHTWQSSPNISIQKRSSDRLRQRARRKENSKEAAQMLTNRFGLPFGGLIAVVAGDFCQLPPVGGKYLYVEPGFNNHKSAEGYNLWRTITSDIVVILDQVQRTKNQDFIALQQKIRQGEWDEELDTTIRSRVGAQIIRPLASESSLV